ncbi:MAG: Ig-like domain-containing protein [Bacteroidales bacterium]|nr:Ig-like domain-containing protein [Bacteroidales bacterium]
MKYCRIILVFLFAVFCSTLLHFCANPVSPAGGPKDVAPPVLTGSDPVPGSVNFSAKTLRLDFDEFIELKNIQEEVILSPPTGELPEIKLRGKSVIVEFNDDLLENTTYNIFFGDAITDITEGNPLTSFHFSFSTGPYIDSLMVEGTVHDAFTGEPVKGAFVMLYPPHNDTVPQDSLPLKVRPYYLSKSDDKGYFRINNVKNGPLKLFALKDVNANLIYDLPNESIAFADSLITPVYEGPTVDTVLSASVKDTSILSVQQPDTLLQPAEKHGIGLFMFAEYDSVQQLLSTTLIKPGHLVFTFRYPAKAPEAVIMTGGIQEADVLTGLNEGRDSLTLWLRDIESDTLYCLLLDQGEALDTIITSLKPKGGRRMDKDNVIIPKLQITSNTKGKTLPPFLPVTLGFNYPVEQVTTDRIILVSETDTLSPEIFFDGDIKRNAKIQRKWTEKAVYTLIIMDSSFSSFAGITNDSTTFRFSVKAAEDYGSFTLHLKAGMNDYSYILHLIEGKDKVIREVTLTGGGEAFFNHLNPGQYKLRCIEDRNRNNRWDTGSYLDRLQPERVFFYPMNITILPNWDLVEEWEIPSP